MTMTLDEVIAVARQMSPDDRAAIVAAIDPAEGEFTMTDELRAELDRRWAAHEADPTSGITFEQLRAKLAAK